MRYSRFEPNSLCKFGGQIPCDHAPQLGEKAQKNLGESDELSGSLTFSPQQSMVPEGAYWGFENKEYRPLQAYDAAAKTQTLNGWILTQT